MTPEGNIAESSAGARRTWGSSGMATLIPTPKAAPSLVAPIQAVTAEGRAIVGPNQNDLVVSDAVTEVLNERNNPLFAEHQRPRLEAAARDMEATTSGSASLPTLDLTGSEAAAPANFSQVLSADTSCWNLSQEIAQQTGAALKTPEDAKTIDQREAIEAQALELARKANEEHAQMHDIEQHIWLGLSRAHFSYYMR